MRILLQHTGSRLYFQSNGVWVPDESQARAFKSALDAIEFCEQQGLTGIEIVLRPSTSSSNLPLPLPIPPRDQPSAT